MAFLFFFSFRLDILWSMLLHLTNACCWFLFRFAFVIMCLIANALKRRHFLEMRANEWCVRITVVVVGASEHQSGDMMKFVFQIDLSVIAALISSMLSPVSLFKTSISVVFGRPLLRGSSGAQKISEPAGSL